MSTTWSDIARPFWKRETDMRRLLGRQMMLEFGQISPYDLPLGQQMAAQIAQASNVTMGQLADVLGRGGVPGPMVQEAVETIGERAIGGTARAVGQLYQYYNPTALAVERARLGLQLANLRNQFYRNQIMQDMMAEQSGGGVLGGLGSLIGGIAKLAGGLKLGSSLFGGGMSWLPMAGAIF